MLMLLLKLKINHIILHFKIKEDNRESDSLLKDKEEIPEKNIPNKTNLLLKNKKNK